MRSFDEDKDDDRAIAAKEARQDAAQDAYLDAMLKHITGGHLDLFEECPVLQCAEANGK